MPGIVVRWQPSPPRSDSLSERVYDASMQRTPDLDDAVQDLSEAVGHRLILIDETMRVVGYSIHESDTDHAAAFARPGTQRRMGTATNSRSCVLC